MKKLLKQLKKAIHIQLRGTLSYLVPKKKRYYAFFPIQFKKEFAGNVKALILYIQQNHKEISTVLLSFDKDVTQEAKKYGLSTKDSLIGITWASLRAEHILIDASTAGNFIRGNFSLIQLWHGSGFKQVGLLNDNINKKQEKELKSIYKKYRIIVSTSESEAKKQNVSFNSNNVIVTGYPRNDVFFENRTHFDNLKIKYNLENYDKIITYAPTFRDTKPSPPFSDLFYQKLQSFLEENNALFIVKKHPIDKFLIIPENYQNIKDLSKKFQDVQELLLISDVLISDYSSIVTDFALTQKPILIYPYDLKEYMETCRSMYYNIEKILPQPFVKDENDLLEKLKDNSWRETSGAIDSYENFVNTFHKYLDGKSSQRVMDAILKLNN